LCQKYRGLLFSGHGVVKSKFTHGLNIRVLASSSSSSSWFYVYKVASGDNNKQSKQTAMFAVSAQLFRIFVMLSAGKDNTLR